MDSSRLTSTNRPLLVLPRLNQGGKQTLYQVRTREDVCNRQAHRHGSLIAIAAQPDEARQTLRQAGLWPGNSIHGPSGPLAGDAAVDQSWIECSDTFVVESDALHDTGAESSRPSHLPWQ